MQIQFSGRDQLTTVLGLSSKPAQTLFEIVQLPTGNVFLNEHTLVKAMPHEGVTDSLGRSVPKDTVYDDVDLLCFQDGTQQLVGDYTVSDDGQKKRYSFSLVDGENQPIQSAHERAASARHFMRPNQAVNHLYNALTMALSEQSVANGRLKYIQGLADKIKEVKLPWSE